MMFRTASLVLFVGTLVPSAGTSAQEDRKDASCSWSCSAAQYRWSTAGGEYLDPSSFFSLHGYVEGVFAGESADWTAEDPTGISAPGQVLVPNTAASSFQWDAALFVGSELSERTRIMMELHTVTDPSGSGAAGPGGLTLVMTEATASWDLFREHLTLSAGLFWAPFSTLNHDWLGAQNLFALIPDAAGFFPAHLNERGVRLDGAFGLGESAGLNYVVSVGNGAQSFGIGGQTAVDANNDRTVMGRIGVFPGLSDRLEVGFSYGSGALRETADPGLPVDDPAGFAAQFDAYAIDVTLSGGPIEVRGYAGRSQEDLSGRTASDPTLTREGALLEASVPVTLRLPGGITQLSPKVRLDYARSDELDASGAAADFESIGYSAGLTVQPGRQMSLSIEYHVRDEINFPELSNNRLVLRLTGEF